MVLLQLPAPLSRRDVRHWWANANLQQLLVAAIALVIAYIVISTVLGALWRAAVGPRHQHHHGGAARHRSIVDPPPEPHRALHTDSTVQDAGAEAEDADTLLSMLGQHPVEKHVDQTHAASHSSQGQRQDGRQVQQEAHHQVGELPPLEPDWQQPRRGFGLYADDGDDTPPVDVYATQQHATQHHEPEDGVVDAVCMRIIIGMCWCVLVHS